MDAQSQHDRADAQAGLDNAAESRAAAVRYTRRPAGIDLALAGTSGAGVALVLAGHWIVAMVVLALGCTAVVVVQRKLSRRRGQVLDQRALGARAWRFALVYLVLFVLTTIRPPSDWEPWFAIGAGLVTVAGGFAWLRWDDRYQGRRLARGDYDRYDLL